MAKSLDGVSTCESGAKRTAIFDDNNNSHCNGDKNTRRGIKRPYVDSDDDDSDPNNNNGHVNLANSGDSEECQVRKPSSGKYQLRPRALQPRRLADCDWNFQDTLRPKQRHPPLSRYRRKTANARERFRMRQINSAFENLRGVLPSWVCSRRPPSDMTKISTLKLASAYIKSLQDILDGKDPNDTCSWVLSALLEEESQGTTSISSQVSSPSASNHEESQNISSISSDAEADLVSLLCSSSNPPPAPPPPPQIGCHDNLEATFSYLTPMVDSDAMALFLSEGHSPTAWSEGAQISLV